MPYIRLTAKTHIAHMNAITLLNQDLKKNEKFSTSNYIIKQSCHGPGSAVVVKRRKAPNLTSPHAAYQTVSTLRALFANTTSLTL